MKIKKLGHCCLRIEIDGLVILTDPGAYSVEANARAEGIDIVLITHEHPDHLHIDSVRKVLESNPDATIVTNSGVGKQLEAAGITFQLLEGTANSSFKGVFIEAFDCKHGEIYEEMGQVQNTGYWMGGKLFYPGDSLADPGKPIDVLALPVAGPWLRLCDAIRYALAMKPRTSFPVHDGMFYPERMGPIHRVPDQVLGQQGIKFVSMIEGDEAEF